MVNFLLIQDDFLLEELSDEKVTTSEIIENWWSKFNDPVLDTLISRARKNNLDINLFLFL